VHDELVILLENKPFLAVLIQRIIGVLVQRFCGDVAWPEFLDYSAFMMASGLRSASPFVHVVCSPDPDPAQLRLFWQNHPNQRRDLP
jgi:hypothetical protein